MANREHLSSHVNISGNLSPHSLSYHAHVYFSAEALEAKGHLKSATPATMATALEEFPSLRYTGDSSRRSSEGSGFVPYPQTQPEAFVALVDETMGFPPLAPK